eukprot:TRINITY_DN603_c0_g1_i1.p1 TRINITY_DN603_c0_g1~~TRINITY_DN603_c0_g1_i1.p1  ORF type:complete len:251 (-),score=76.22 TRINITY_DN603_c0_g1_i1:16-768(-)
MKFNISDPVSGGQKTIAIDDENQYRALFDKKMGDQFPGETLGQQFAGYVFKITGGNDKEGFSMRQGILKNGRVRILMKKGHKCYRPRREGERKRKSVRGCIVGKDISVLALSIVQHGEKPIPAITDKTRARSLGPKRASKIRKLYSLESKDDVRKYIVRKDKKNNKKKAPKIQRLVTQERIRRKKAVRKIRLQRIDATKKAVGTYKKMLEELRKKKVDKKAAAKSAKKDVAAKPAVPKQTGTDQLSLMTH